MSETSMFIYLLITTLYGWFMYKRGEKFGTRQLARLCVDAKIVKSYEAMKSSIDNYFQSLEAKYNRDR